MVEVQLKAPLKTYRAGLGKTVRMFFANDAGNTGRRKYQLTEKEWGEASIMVLPNGQPVFERTDIIEEVPEEATAPQEASDDGLAGEVV